MKRTKIKLKKVNKESYTPSASLIRSIKQTNKDYREGKVKSFSSVEAMMKSLKSK